MTFEYEIMSTVNVYINDIIISIKYIYFNYFNTSYTKYGYLNLI